MMMMFMCRMRCSFLGVVDGGNEYMSWVLLIRRRLCRRWDAMVGGGRWEGATGVAGRSTMVLWLWEDLLDLVSPPLEVAIPLWNLLQSIIQHSMKEISSKKSSS